MRPADTGDGFRPSRAGDGHRLRRARGGGRPQAASRATHARLAALDVTRTARERDAFAHDLIVKRIEPARLSAEDKAFATRLVLGVVSCQGTLDEVIDRVLASPDDVRPDLRDALRISAYEILFMGKEPHAAVDQGVELARFVAPRAAGLANSVLRKVVAAKREFPFGDPRTSLPAFARLHAFPEWLARRLVEDLGAQAAHDLMRAANEPAPLFVALSCPKADEDEELGVLRDAKGDPAPAASGGVDVCGCYRLGNARALADGRARRLINTGKLLVADASSQAVAQLSLPEELCESFLEVGAGRGTKTILVQGQALRRFGAQVGRYVAVDNAAFKVDLTRERAQAYGVALDRALCADGTRLRDALGEERFAAVLVDAPCSGVGTLRRHPEIRWRLRPESITRSADTGLSLLRSAAEHVQDGGILSYSTCTVFPEENMCVVEAFLRSPEGAAFRMADERPFAPPAAPGGPDAHFCARLVREGAEG